MAELPQTFESMKDISQTLELETENNDHISQEENEEEKERDPNYYEERFRVDRRKLEQMIQGDEGEDELADVFFHRVMEETSTNITWPSKLKIGAKSKKDPHIKVAGTRETVQAAKERIMAILDTKSTRVTLKMDVSHTEHSHVIGKGGNNIKRVMQETGCHIHFPDSNRNNQAEKSNQVSIAGQPEGVEQARVKIRELLPLVVMFELPVTGLPLPDPSSPPIKQLQDTYDVTVSFKQRPRTYYSTVIIRGSVENAKGVKEATSALIEKLIGATGGGTNVAVSVQLEIAPQHHMFIMGRAGSNLKHIMQQTGATVHFPDPAACAQQRKGTVFISGAIDSVILARSALIGCLPLVLMFDMKDDVELDQAQLNHLMERLDVFISIKPKPKQPSKSVIVKSIERNAASLHCARRRLLGHTTEPLTPVATMPGLLPQRVLNTSSVLMLNGTRSLPPPSPSPSPGCLYSPPPMVLMPYAVPYALTPRLPHSPTTPTTPQPSNTDHGLQRQSSNDSHYTHNDAPPSTPTTTTTTTPAVANQNNTLQSDATTVLNLTLDQLKVLQDSGLDLANLGNLGDLANLGKLPRKSSFVHENVQSDANPLVQSHLDNIVSSGTALVSPTTASSYDLAASHAGSDTSLLDVLLPSTPNLAELLSKSPTSADDLLRMVAAMQTTTAPHTPRSRSPPAVTPSFKSSRSPLSTGTHTPNVGHPLSHSPPGLSVRSRSPPGLGRHSAGESPMGTSPALQSSPSMSRRAIVSFQNGERRSSESGDSDSSDNRAPGSNRPIKPAELSNTSMLFEDTNLFDVIDYEQKKKLATKAMLKKPDGESRTPNGLWSGLGFSKSMPDKSIRENLRTSKVRYNGPSMTTTYEEEPPYAGETPWSGTQRSPNSSFNGAVPSTYDSPQKSGYGSPLESPPTGASSSSSSASSQNGSCSCTDLVELFSKLGLGKYTDLFTQQEIDLNTFRTMTEQDLKELGIATFGARRKMLIAISDLNRPPAPLMSAAPGANNPFRDAGPSSILPSTRRQDIASQSGRW